MRINLTSTYTQSILCSMYLQLAKKNLTYTYTGQWCSMGAMILRGRKMYSTDLLEDSQRLDLNFELLETNQNMKSYVLQIGRS